MNANDADIEKGAACAAALEELFRQYPTVDCHFGSKRGWEWRERAIMWAQGGDISVAITWAMGTGVPDDVLLSLKGLLDE